MLASASESKLTYITGYLSEQKLFGTGFEENCNTHITRKIRYLIPNIYLP